MAQITGATSFKDAKVEISANGSSWTDVSGASNQITIGGGDRAIAETPTFDGDTMILTGGKRAALDVALNAVYTEGASDTFELARAAYEAGTSFYVRWSPKGGQTGEFQYTSDAGIIGTFNWPGGEASSANPVMAGFTLKTPKVTKSAVA